MSALVLLAGWAVLLLMLVAALVCWFVQFRIANTWRRRALDAQATLKTIRSRGSPRERRGQFNTSTFN